MFLIIPKVNILHRVSVLQFSMGKLLSYSDKIS